MRILLLLCLAIISISVKGQYYLTNEESQFISSTSWNVLQDKSERLTSTEVIKDNFFWSSATNLPLLVLPEPGVYWLKVSVKNTSAIQHWILEFPDVHISELAVFQQLKDGTVQTYSTLGFDKSFYPRTYDHKNYFYPFELRKDEEVTLFIRIKSRYPTSFGAYIRSVPYQFSYFLREYYLLGIFYGILAIMAMYNFFLFVFLREKIYGYYVVYVLTGGLYTLSEDGIGFQFLWPEFPIINHFLFTWSPFLFLSMFTLYAWEFLDIRRKSKWFKAALLAALALNLLSSLFSFYCPVYVKAILYLFPFVLVYLKAIMMYRNGFVAARFFIAGYSVVLISFIVFFLRMIQWIPTNLYSFYVFNIGMIVEVVMLSYALGDRFRIVKKENEMAQQKLIGQLYENEKLKDKVNKELEEKVRERTIQLETAYSELREANGKLNELTEQLNNANVLLDKDNWHLKNLVKEETRSRILQEKVSYEEYLKIFPTDFACLTYLEKLKWEDGYVCKKCNNTVFTKDDETFSRRCTKCKYVESVSAGTLFHGIKFPLNKAFYIAYDTCDEKNRSTIDALSEKIDLRRVTVWMFRKKVLEVYKVKSTSKNSSWESLLLHKQFS